MDYLENISLISIKKTTAYAVVTIFGQLRIAALNEFKDNGFFF
jgi:hypothetical protein